MKIALNLLLLFLIFCMNSCSSDTKDAEEDNTSENQEIQEIQETTDGVASVTEVSVTGEEDLYSFNVTISSPDLGCQQYVDWWEVIDLDGNLLYRRIFTHSHVDEQPFTRLGDPFNISANEEVYIRAHMNTTSYGTNVFKGSVADGFSSSFLASDFALNLEEVEPLPGNCAF